MIKKFTKKNIFYLVVLFVVLALLLINLNYYNVHYYELKVLKYVNLSDYKNKSISSDKIDYSKDELNNAILLYLSANGIYKEEDNLISAKKGNVIIADFIILNSREILINEEKMPYIIGSKIYGSEFDKAVIGMKKGEKKEFNIEINESASFDLPQGSYKIRMLLHEIYLPIKISDEEEIIKAYECTSMDEVYYKVKESLCRLTIVEDAYESLLTSSTINELPKEGEQYIENMIKKYQKMADDKGLSLSDYLSSEYQITISELQDSLKSYFGEWMVLKAVTENEGIYYSKNDYEKEVQLFANEKGIAYDEVILQYDEVDLSYDMFYRDIETILLKYTKIE